MPIPVPVLDMASAISMTKKKKNKKRKKAKAKREPCADRGRWRARRCRRRAARARWTRRRAAPAGRSAPSTGAAAASRSVCPGRDPRTTGTSPSRRWPRSRAGSAPPVGWLRLSFVSFVKKKKPNQTKQKWTKQNKKAKTETRKMGDFFLPTNAASTRAESQRNENKKIDRMHNSHDNYDRPANRFPWFTYSDDRGWSKPKRKKKKRNERSREWRLPWARKLKTAADWSPCQRGSSWFTVYP